MSDHFYNIYKNNINKNNIKLEMTNLLLIIINIALKLYAN
jgi:hypothetical protein